MTPAPRLSPPLSSCLYIRIEDDLRAALCSAAEREGLRLSDLARAKLREAVAPSRDGNHSGPDASQPEPAALDRTGRRTIRG